MSESFCVQRLLVHGYLWPHENSRERRHLLESKMDFGVWIWRILEKLAKSKNNSMYLPVRRGLFDRSVEAKNENKGFQKAVGAF